MAAIFFKPQCVTIEEHIYWYKVKENYTSFHVRSALTTALDMLRLHDANI